MLFKRSSNMSVTYKMHMMIASIIVFLLFLVISTFGTANTIKVNKAMMNNSISIETKYAKNTDTGEIEILEIADFEPVPDLYFAHPM